MAAAKDSEFTVERIFPQERLTRLNVSKNVRSFTPGDFADMAKAFGVPAQPTENKKVNALTHEDLVSIDALFTEYRYEVIANFQGVHKLSSAAHLPQNLKATAAGSSCCCCCTPCCSCCSAAVQVDPFAE